MASTISAGWPEDVDHQDPPVWELPGVVPVERILTWSAQVVISVGQFRVFSTGALVTFEVRLADRCADEPAYSENLFGLLTTRGRTPSPDYPALDLSPPNSPEAAAAPRRPGPRLKMRSGGSTGRVWHFTYWLSPTPTEDVIFRAAWPMRGVPAGETTITSQDLHTASEAIQRL